MEAVKRFQQVRAKGALAVLVVVYGNREFEDALLEPKNLAFELGFNPLAGAAFIGEHLAGLSHLVECQLQRTQRSFILWSGWVAVDLPETKDKLMPRAALAKPTKPAQAVYQLRLTLQETDPPVWRRLLVPSNVSLAKLHKIIQRAMGWSDSHLHQFMVGKQIYAPPDPEDFDPGHKPLSERTHRLEQVAFRARMKLLYLYDFGDDWLHEVLVEKVLPLDPSARYPVCLEGARACPPEDCGGAPGYEDLLEALSDPSHPEHEDVKDWLGADFDPEALDLDKVNRSLARLR